MELVAAAFVVFALIATAVILYSVGMAIVGAKTDVNSKIVYVLVSGKKVSVGVVGSAMSVGASP